MMPSTTSYEIKMKKEELKQVLKPLIKECIKECIFEEGVLSGIISEVVSGLETQRVVTEGITIRPKDEGEEKQRELEEKYELERQERIKRLNEASMTNVDVFQGTEVIPSEPSAGNPLAGVRSSDSGVNIDGIVGLSGGKWKQLI